ncbi:MAG: DNA recombination protein RmuC [Saprospiraceae bacterium]|nr:DNA recombination protein RmuC [Saprospiraceae bacterium]
MNELTVCLLFLLLGLIIGGLLSWLFARVKFAANHLSQLDLQEKYVSRQQHDAALEQTAFLHNELKTKQEDIVFLEKTLSSKERDLLYLEEKLTAWKKDYETLQQRAHLEFENVASRLLEEKSKKFSDQNEKQLNDLLHPLREKIREFGQDVERRFTDEAKDKVSLKKEIEQLRDLNQQLSLDARNLASALKGDSKVQGDWGEMQLEMLLEKSGLVRGTHFEAQTSFKDVNGHEKRPDFIIYLPDEKHLIVDSKVSLKAYEKFYNAENEELRGRHLKEHVDSIRQHLRDLSSKNYPQLTQLNSPDYLLMFIPIEPAFAVALQHDNRLFLDALEKNIVIVTSSTLLATMRTVSYIWRQERQKRNVLEIARQSGMLYDKFVGFVEDLREVGTRLDHAQSALNGALNKLSDSKKYGDTLIGRAQKIKELGAKATKSLPADLLTDETSFEEELVALPDEKLQ